MTALTQSTKRRLSLLQLAEELGNVSKACKIMGYRRDTFYEVRRAFQVGGVAALVEEKRGLRHPHPNRVAPEVEEKILDYALRFPTHGPQRVSNELRLAGTEDRLAPITTRHEWRCLRRHHNSNRPHLELLPAGVRTPPAVRLLACHQADSRIAL